MMWDRQLRVVHVEKLKYGIQERVSRALADSVRVDEFAEHITQGLIVRVTADLLAERLPTQTVHGHGHFEVPRFATWHDAFRATYRGRWWGRLLRLREPRFVMEPLTHEVNVDVRAHWTYPQATTVLPANDWGRVVLKAEDLPPREWLRYS